MARRIIRSTKKPVIPRITPPRPSRRQRYEPPTAGWLEVQNPEGFVPNEIMVGTPKDGKWLVESIKLESGVYVVKLKAPTATPLPAIPGAPKPATPLPVPRGTTPPGDEKKPQGTSRRSPGLRPGIEMRAPATLRVDAR